MTKQPQWKLIAQLGDADPVSYGGYFVYIDKTGVYDPEAEYLEAPEEDDSPEGWTAYRIILEPCTLINGILSDNQYHPETPAWFAQPESKRVERPHDTTYLSNVATFQGMALKDLQTAFCSEDPVMRAQAYASAAEYHGWREFDPDPKTFKTREEVEKRYGL